MTKEKIAVESSILLCGAEGVADSKILSGFRSMIEAEAVTRAKNSDYAVCGKYCHTGEFGIDIIGETSGIAPQTDGIHHSETAKKLLDGEITAALCLDTNGAPRRAAAVFGLVNMKPTYGTVSRYGVLPVVSSADTVSVTAKTAEACEKLLSVISGIDEKDATTVCAYGKEKKEDRKIRKIGIPFGITDALHEETKKNFDHFIASLKAKGVETVDIPKEKSDVFSVAHAVWNTVLCAEAWGNLSRYDGIRYGNSAKNVESLADLYVKTRSEGFGSLIKTVLLYGSCVLSAETDGGRFFKAAKAREWVKAEINRLFSELDGILIPATSVPFYTEENIKTRGITAFNENFYTSISSLCGLPALTANGVQMIGRPFSDAALLHILNGNT